MKFTSATRFTGFYAVVFYFYGFYRYVCKLNMLKRSEFKCFKVA